jgi:putative ABC transport system substrate-binding protein
MGTPAAVAAKDATTAIPIVMGAVGDPVSVGIVSNLARPGGNITGFATQNVDLEGKRLELLKDLLPHLSRVGVLANATNPLLTPTLQQLRPVAEALRVTIDVGVNSSKEWGCALLRQGAAMAGGHPVLSPQGCGRSCALFPGGSLPSAPADQSQASHRGR